MIHFRLENRTIFVRNISTCFALHHTRDHTYSAYQLKSVYISALIKSFIYISTSPNNSLAANTRHLQYIYHGLFHEREAVWFKRVESFFFWGRRGWRYTFRFAPNLTISASLNQLSAPKMLNSWQTAACFASGTPLVVGRVWSSGRGVSNPIIVLFLIVLFVLLCDFFFAFGKR